jgi:hypothetical protein
MQLVLIVPDRNTGSRLDPGLPGTGLGRGKGEGAEAGPGLPNREEKDQLEFGIQQKWRKHNERQGRTNSGRDARGSAANRVRLLPIHSL